MSSQDASSSNTLDLVNSFYGPSATACWYLTCLSCLISWTLHPKKSTSDSITSDLIALATFPTVASAHLLNQVKDYARQARWAIGPCRKFMPQWRRRSSLRKRISLSASFLLLLALTGIFCFASEICLFFSIPSIRNTSGIFDRSFLVDSLPVLVAVLVLVSILIFILLVFLYFLLDRRYPSLIVDVPPEADLEVAELFRDLNQHHIHMLQNRRMGNLTHLSTLFLPLSFAVSLTPTSTDIWQQLIKRRGVLGEFSPKTDSRIMDLDQAVSLLAGMTVFGFSLYSAADARHQSWWEAERFARGRSLR
jgi:hypothetical protein